MRKRAVVLCSGGLDSTVLLHYAAKQLDMDIVKVLCFNYGSKHNKREAAYSVWQTGQVKKAVVDAGKPFSPITQERHSRLDLPFINEFFKSSLLKSGGTIPEGHYADENMKSTVVPFRNGIMLSIATGFAESLDCDRVLIANHAGDHAIYPDCRTDFISKMSAAMCLGTYKNVMIHAPFSAMTKAEIVRMGSLLSVDMAMTWSCYKGGELHCGKCGTCIERREAFHLAGIPDPTEYEAGAPTLEELISCDFKYEATSL